MPPSAPSATTQRALLLTATVSTISLFATWGMMGFIHRPAHAHTALADLLIHTPLAGIATALLALISGSGFAALALSSARKKAEASQQSRVAMWPQSTILLPFLVIAIGASTRAVLRGFSGMSVGNGAATAITVCLVGLALLFLLADRVLSSRPEMEQRSIRGLTGLLRLAVSVFLISAVLSGCNAAGTPIPTWFWKLPAFLTLYGTVEISARLVASWFAPPPSPATAQSCVDVILFRAPSAFAPGQLADTLQQRFGLDFERSWALGFVRRTFLPISAIMLLLAWAGSGIVQIAQDRRGVYERLGVPIAVLDPGLHVTLPAPFGRVRQIEFGTIHSLAVTDAPLAAHEADISKAEDEPPSSANRLWDGSPDDASWLIAREQSGNRAGFEMLTANLRILYRVRMSQQGAMDALYTVSSPETLLNSLAHRSLTDFFASETMDGVMATRREHIAQQISEKLQTYLNHYHSGLEIVAVLIDGIQPPATTAKSWRMVQAAEVKAQTSIAEENTRAEGTHALAERDAYELRAQSTAEAETIRRTAVADTLRMNGDEAAWQTGGQAFLLERYLGNLKQSLEKTSLTIVDGHLHDGVFDLRATSSSSRALTDAAGTK
ncbi:SPFH domain-containing protein [Acetobacter sp.]|uniref:SPFH domain-containing protein n=1 Tax=Acetobacter sp. TaxID=440 RepID=UPI0039E7EAD9